EGLDVLDLLGLRPVTDGFDLFTGHGEYLRGRKVLQVFVIIQVELTFLWFCVKAVKPKLAEYLSDMLLMRLLVSAVGYNVIQVDNHTNIQHICEDCVHKALEGGWGIGEAKGHH
ncbi:hypothetical protein M404DRAFT_152606, partial [Pisolithus tinctorius Marx 270]